MVRKTTLVKSVMAAFLAALLSFSYAQAETALSEEQQKLNADLVYQAFFGEGDAILELVEQGANPHALNSDGVPALSVAATRKGEKGLNAMKALLASRADIDQVDQQGQTALFYAARVGNLDATKLLLEMGADYYHTDKSGTIARNIAYSRGYMDVFNYMDGFVNTKREAVMEEYEERAKQIEEREKQQAKAIEDAKKAAAAKAAKDAEEKEQNKVVKQPKPAKRELNEEELAEFKRAARALSFHSCSMQYWYYVKSAGLKTPLTSSELSEKVAEHRGLAKTQEEILLDLGAKRKYTSKISEPSKDQIFKQLEAFGSNITRKSHGIGEIGDDKTRCDKVADNWVFELPN